MKEALRQTRQLVLDIRPALRILLIAALVTFIASLFWRFEIDKRVAAERLVFEDEIRLSQREFEKRIAAVEEAALSQKKALEERLQGLSLRPSARDRSGRPEATPLLTDRALGSIVELVCIDNVDKDIYYTGSGTVIDKSGLIMTNRHILASSDDSLITYCGAGFTTDLQKPPRIEYIAAVTAMHDETDLAMLKITEHLDGRALPKEFSWISLEGSADAARALSLGDPVYIGGYPGIGAETFTFTEGVVSGRVGQYLIKTSALIDSGASGGAAFDSEGRYIGVPTAAVRGDIGGSLGYLIGADAVDAFLAEYYGGERGLPKPE